MALNLVVFVHMYPISEKNLDHCCPNVARFRGQDALSTHYNMCITCARLTPVRPLTSEDLSMLFIYVYRSMQHNVKQAVFAQTR